ncbi:MAG: hypothetical protein RDV41_13995 [Planctomycetota bacterium]|nr:hypothetical protein [Planctomycetota bacterium]
MAKACINHQGTIAITQCFQCHRPICSMCVTDTPHGKFCSTECSIKYLDYKKRFPDEKKKGSPALRKLVGTTVIVIAALIGIHILHAWVGIEAVGKVDIIGKLFGSKPKELLEQGLKEGGKVVEDAKDAIKKK